MIKLLEKYRQLEKRLLHVWPLRLIVFFFLIALVHPFVANERPIYCKIDGNHYFPASRNLAVNWGFLQPYKDNFDFQWKKKDYEMKIMPFIPYSYNTIDRRNSQYRSPFGDQETDNFWQRHWLGTDILGRDVAAGLLKGTEIAIRIGFLSIALAGLIALVVGFLAAYFRVRPLKVGPLDILAFILFSFVLIYNVWIAANGKGLASWMSVVIVLLISYLYYHIRKHYQIEFLNKWMWNFPVEGMYLRTVEAFKALPVLILLLACVSIFETISISGLVVILALLMWPGLSRYVRAESLKVLSQDYVTAAEAYGASKFRILTRHVTPKLVSRLSVILVFAISTAIIVEATLAFLGIGLPIEQVSWGSMLKEAKDNFSAWWLAIFPGLALFTLILSLNILGEDLEKK